MKAINTKYKGYNFRSRLEARWAVYFDSLGIEWEYEKEGFKFEDGTCYLPDFWLPKIKMFVEIKPTNLTEKENHKCEMLAKESNYGVLILIGIPKRKPYNAIFYFNDICGQSGFIENNFALSNYHNYPINENRFYSSFDDNEINGHHFDDINNHIRKAKSARFEFGENGK